MLPHNYKIFEVGNMAEDVIEFWKAPSRDDLLAWLHDTYCLSILQMLGYEITEVSMEEAAKSIISHEDCERYRDTPLAELFRNADDGCVLLATTN